MTSKKNNIPALLLIGIGIILLLLNFSSGYLISNAWWLIFFILAAGFFLPAFIWPKSREGLSALFIPGTIMASLGLIFLYNVTTNDWDSWAYMWTLLPCAVGLGIYLAAKYGKWERGVAQVGIWIMGFSLAAFLLFSGRIIKTVGAVILILIGIRMMRQKNSVNDQESSA